MLLVRIFFKNKNSSNIKNMNFYLKSLNLIKAELGMLYQIYQFSNYFSLNGRMENNKNIS